LEGVKASHNFIGKFTSDIFHEDLLNVFNQKLTKIRPVVGANGAGKTTLLKFEAKKHLLDIAPFSYLYLFFDFKSITEDIYEFWPIFLQNLIDQLVSKENIIATLINKLSPDKRSYQLTKIFKNSKLIDNLLKLTSQDLKEQSGAFEYFYGENLKTKNIRDFFYGLLKLALQLDFMVVIAFDEVQFLNEIDTSNVLLKLFLEQFVRHLMEKHANEKLYILLSCLENPDLKEWTKLKSYSRNFESIVRDKDILLGSLSVNEKNSILQQIADKIGFDEENRRIFFTKVKSSLMYYFPRDLLKWIANVIDKMGYTGYTDYEIRQIYEDDARKYIEEMLKNKGFINLEPEPKEVGGYNVDIYAESSTHRAGHVPKAYGEVTMIDKARLKQKVEKFANWLYRMKGREFKPEKGDFAFFICPYQSISKGIKDVLENNNIEIYPYISTKVEGIKTSKAVEEPITIVSPETQVGTEQKGTLKFIQQIKYKLRDVPGIGEKTEAKLKRVGILTIKDLLECSVNAIAKQIDRVGVASLNKWKQNARQILTE